MAFQPPPFSTNTTACAKGAGNVSPAAVVTTEFPSAVSKATCGDNASTASSTDFVSAFAFA
jgi:hypothetical protein